MWKSGGILLFLQRCARKNNREAAGSSGPDRWENTRQNPPPRERYPHRTASKHPDGRNSYISVGMTRFHIHRDFSSPGSDPGRLLPVFWEHGRRSSGVYRHKRWRMAAEPRPE